MGYLHGVEIKTIAQGTKSIAVVNTAVVGLVGIAAQGTVNKPVLITSLSQAQKEFGKDVAGTTIMSALQTIFDNGGAACIVVNVGTTAKMTTAIDTATNKVKLISNKYATQIYEPTPVSTGGFVDFSADVVSGLDLLLTAESAFGIKPKIIIAPGFSHLATVVQKFKTIAPRLRAIAFADIQADTVTAAIASRGATGNVSDSRIVYCFPAQVRFNVDDAVNNTAGLSQYYASGCVYRDNNDGYWVSPSGYEPKGIIQSVIPITSGIGDELADSNMLNAAGIATIFRTFGTGIKLWGNWTSNFPTNNDLKSMIAPSRVADVVDESIQQATLQFVDKAVGKPLIACILNSVNQFMKTLITRGAIIDGTCIFDADKNPSTEIAQGKLLFTYTFCPAPSLDRLTFESVVDIEVLKKLA